MLIFIIFFPNLPVSSPELCLPSLLHYFLFSSETAAFHTLSHFPSLLAYKDQERLSPSHVLSHRSVQREITRTEESVILRLPVAFSASSSSHSSLPPSLLRTTVKLDDVFFCSPVSSSGYFCRALNDVNDEPTSQFVALLY